MASQARASSKRSGEIQKSLPNQYTEYERWQRRQSPKLLLPLLEPSLVPRGMWIFSCFSSLQGCLFCASWIGYKIRQIRYHTVYSNVEFQISQIHAVISWIIAQTNSFVYLHLGKSYIELEWRL
jgi:hypothetical protein